MIIDASAIVEGYPFVAKRWQRVPICDPAAIHACCEWAEALADGASDDEPASIFFAFADRRRAFLFAWKLMAVLLARRQAALNGFSLDSTASELDALCIDVLYKHASWETIRAWFTLRLRATDE